MTVASLVPASGEVISLSEERASARTRSFQLRAREVGEQAFARAEAYDEDGAFPAADVDALRESGLLTAAMPSKRGSAELTGVSLSEALRSIGSGSLPLGRLFEGHVNALELVLRYGNRDQIEMFGRRSSTRQALRRLEHRRLEWTAPDSKGRALRARRSKDPGVGRGPYRTSLGDRDLPRRPPFDGSSKTHNFRSCRPLELEGARYASFGDRGRRFHRCRSRAARDRRRRWRL